MALTPLASPLTATGVGRLSVVPSPDWPCWLAPQHLTSPPAPTAQVWASPAVIAVTPLDSPLTATDVRRSVLVPSPSWPALFAPQHLTSPPAVTAHVWKYAA